MSSYEKQMQWRKAAIVKTKKLQEDKAAEQPHSFTPVFFTQSSSNGVKDIGERHSKQTIDGRNGRPHQSTNRNHVESSSHRHKESDGMIHSPTGASSIGSNAPSHYSESSAQHEGGYGSSCAEKHANHHSKSYGDHYREYIAQDDDVSIPSASVGKCSPLLSRKEREQSHHYHRSTSRQGSYSKRHGSKHRSNRQSSTHPHHSRDRSHSIGSRRSHSSCTNSDSGRSRGQVESSGEYDKADEPIIELLERERRQWREEREQLIQCIHLQQLELAQRSVAAHERAADIAKEFARAIECFEERLVSVEGTVQKEIMSIKSIAESLLHAATISSSATPAGTSSAVLARPIV